MRIVLVVCLGCDTNLFLSQPRCPRLPCRAVSRVGLARQCCPRMPWLYTSNRSPWLMGSPLRRSNSSSFRASQANSSPTTRRRRETGRPFIAAALGFAPAALQTTKMVLSCGFQIKLTPSYYLIRHIITLVR